jgi:hypothetical protein
MNSGGPKGGPSGPVRRGRCFRGRRRFGGRSAPPRLPARGRRGRGISPGGGPGAAGSPAGVSNATTAALSPAARVRRRSGSGVEPSAESADRHEQKEQDERAHA